MGEADFVLDAEARTLDINFSDFRGGVYRNVSYTVRYLDDRTCRTDEKMAEVIARVDPPGCSAVSEMR